MSELKDKLSTSVRQAKGTLRTKTENPAPEALPTDKPTTSKSNTKKVVQPDAVSTSAHNVPESHNTLFPDRIWPD